MSDIEREIDFLHRLANEVGDKGHEFGDGRACGIREAVRPLHAEITHLEASLAAEREKVVERDDRIKHQDAQIDALADRVRGLEGKLAIAVRLLHSATFHNGNDAAECKRLFPMPAFDPDTDFVKSLGVAALTPAPPQAKAPDAGWGA